MRKNISVFNRDLIWFYIKLNIKIVISVLFFNLGIPVFAIATFGIFLDYLAYLGLNDLGLYTISVYKYIKSLLESSSVNITWGSGEAGSSSSLSRVTSNGSSSGGPTGPPTGPVGPVNPDSNNTSNTISEIFSNSEPDSESSFSVNLAELPTEILRLNTQGRELAESIGNFNENSSYSELTIRKNNIIRFLNKYVDVTLILESRTQASALPQLENRVDLISENRYIQELIREQDNRRLSNN